MDQEAKFRVKKLHEEIYRIRLKHAKELDVLYRQISEIMQKSPHIKSAVIPVPEFDAEQRIEDITKKLKEGIFYNDKQNRT
jgi:hypothetical protein